MKQALLAVVQLWEDRLQKQGVVVSEHTSRMQRLGGELRSTFDI